MPADPVAVPITSEIPLTPAESAGLALRGPRGLVRLGHRRRASTSSPSSSVPAWASPAWTPPTASTSTPPRCPPSPSSSSSSTPGCRYPSASWSTGSAPSRVLTLGAGAVHPRPARLRPLPRLRHRARLPRAARLRRRDDLHQRAAARRALVPGPARPVDRSVHRRCSGWPGNLVSHPRHRPGAARPRLDGDLRGQLAGRRRGAGPDAVLPQGPPRGPRAAARRAAGARPHCARRRSPRPWREPGTRLGLWVHFTTQFPAMVFLLLWGHAVPVEAQGLSPGHGG